jgi:hypothetical protein
MVGTARPGLEAAAKARLLEAQAFENLSLSHVRGSRPAQARLRLKRLSRGLVCSSKA